MSKMYISCDTLDEWFGEYVDNEKNWVLPEILEKLCQALADTNILLVDCSDSGEIEKLKNINNGIVSALRDLKRLKKEVTEIIANDEVLIQGKVKKGGAS